MRGGKPIHQRNGAFKRIDDDNRTMVAPACTCNFAAWKCFQLALDGECYAIAKRCGIGDEDRLRGGIVFGLRQEIGCDPIRIGVAIGQNGDFGGAGNHINPNLAKYAPFRRRHKGIAGAYDFSHGRKGLGAIGERRHRLRAADAVDLCNACNPRCRQHQRV